MTTHEEKPDQAAAEVAGPKQTTKAELIDQAQALGVEIKTKWTKAEISEAIAVEMQKRAEAEAARPQTELDKLRVELNGLKAGVATKRERLSDLYDKADALDTELSEIRKKELEIEAAITENEVAMREVLTAYQVDESAVLELDSKIRRHKNKQYHQAS